MTTSALEQPKDLYRICHASVKSKLLETAIQFKIFNLLSEPRSADDITKALGSHLQNTTLFLNALVACKLLIKEKALYRNAPVSEKFLVEGLPTSLGERFARQSAMTVRMNHDLPRLILEGPQAASAENSFEPMKKWADNTAWLGNAARAGCLQQMADIVEKLPEFPRFRRMLDLGGSHGMYCISMVKRHPTMTGTVFDLPPVIEVTKQFIREYQLEERIDVLPGDYNQGSIGQEYDLIWACSSLNFAQGNMDVVMEKIFNALTPSGVFINVSEGLTEEGTQPDFYTLYKVAMIMSKPILPFEKGVIADAMSKAGFKHIQSATLETGWGEKDIDIARKNGDNI